MYAAWARSGPLPMQSGQLQREDSVYQRNGTACLLVAFEPLTGKRLVEVSATRTKADYCRFMQTLVAAYPQAQTSRLVQDNLNTHTASAFYESWAAADARQVAARLEMHYTPKKASWLNRVELELSAIARQCLHQRIADIETLQMHVDQCVKERNEARVTVNWQFTNAQAREKLRRHYQKVCLAN
ncbi:IS630 family transposase [Larkinella bovis]|uniref:IS630 family transposase n=1 Tax=Larkinella bovis TaxID=683041 RepID=A0ABW0ILG9_9BACT